MHRRVCRHFGVLSILPRHHPCLHRSPLCSTGIPVGCAGCATKRLHFAGEHTRTDFPATAHGAYSSGSDAACAVLKAAGKAC